MYKDRNLSKDEYNEEFVYHYVKNMRLEDKDKYLPNTSNTDYPALMDIINQDQNLKYIVRDNLISYMNTLSINCSSKEEVIQIANENLNEFKRIAQNTIYDNGYNYDVSVELGTFEFPSKTYGDISFPAGIYDALRIKIGNAFGNNWWCVMFPPLCFVDITTGIVPNNSKKHLENSLPKEEYSIISNQNNSSYKIKFKLIEFFEKKGLITAQNN